MCAMAQCTFSEIYSSHRDITAGQLLFPWFWQPMQEKWSFNAQRSKADRADLSYYRALQEQVLPVNCRQAPLASSPGTACCVINLSVKHFSI